MVSGAGDSERVSQSSALYRYSVPLKCEKRLNAWCLNWLHGMTNEDCESLLAYMAGDKQKQENTRSFIDFYTALPHVEFLLPGEFLPAEVAAVVKCGPGMRFAFFDSRGHHASMGCRHFAYDPRESGAKAFLGYDSDEQLIVRQRERGIS